MTEQKTGTAAGAGNILLRLEGITKTFGPVVALDRVDLTVRAGEIRGLIGENGSGKSTVSSIFAGMQPADSGLMLFHGKPWRPATMDEALLGGIGMIVQENGTVPGVTVAENLFLCRADDFASFRTSKGKRWGFVSGAAMNRAAKEALADIGAGHIRADAITGTLDMMDRKLIEVAKIWLRRPEILVVDESTTALSQKGREIVYGLMERMKTAGKAVVFISHDLDEIMEKCDTLTVLRDGRIIRTFEKAEFDASLIRTAMIGRELQGDYYRSDFTPTHGEKVALEVRNVSVAGSLRQIDFSVREGEILGIGGLSQCGMHLLGRVLFGAVRPTEGEVLARGVPVTSPARAMELKIGYAAKDRDTDSLCLSASIRDNIAIAGIPAFAVGGGIILPSRERAYVRKQVDFMKIKCYSPDQPVSELSGGNKQKVVFGKWIGAGSEILILDCPTRGIDIGVKQTMYQLMTQMKREGKTVIMISEELSELIGMSDRLLILKNGAVMKEFSRSADLTDAEIIQYMI